MSEPVGAKDSARVSDGLGFFVSVWIPAIVGWGQFRDRNFPRCLTTTFVVIRNYFEFNRYLPIHHRLLQKSRESAILYRYPTVLSLTHVLAHLGVPTALYDSRMAPRDCDVTYGSSSTVVYR